MTTKNGSQRRDVGDDNNKNCKTNNGDDNSKYNDKNNKQ